MAKQIQRIDKVLRRALRKMDLDTRLKGYQVWSVWDDIVGDHVARKAQPEKLRNQILFVKVSSSAWMQQLQTMKLMLLDRIRHRIKGSGIRDIRFFLGEVDPPACTTSPGPRKAQPHAIRLSAEMEGCLDRVEDHELKDLVRNVMVKQAERGRKGEN